MWIEIFERRGQGNKKRLNLGNQSDVVDFDLKLKLEHIRSAYFCS